MLLERSSNSVCASCRKLLYGSLGSGFPASKRAISNRLPQTRGSPRPRIRAFHCTRLRQAVQGVASKRAEDEGEVEPTFEELEAAARTARNTFGDSLPEDHLSPKEYRIYERLYGPPIKVTDQNEDSLTDQDLLDEERGEDAEVDEHTLYREREDGELEEIVKDDVEDESIDSSLLEDLDASQRLETESEDEHAARIVLMREIKAATEYQSDEYVEDEQDLHEEEEEESSSSYEGPELDESEKAHDEDTTRSHPYTDAGRFATYPRSITLPRNTFTGPVSAILSTASNKQLAELTRKTFGDILQDSVATPFSKGHHLQQKPIALEASQPRMGTMEANSYIAANMPGLYASVMSTLVETRRRLGSSWIEGLLQKEGGPRVLDAGGAGAGVLAWHEVLRAEWERMHAGASPMPPVPLGKTTVIVGSPELRQRVKLLLENTTFLPRMQEFMSARDLPGSTLHNPALRKQYDLIIAPHTLWTLKEEHMRKAQVQNCFTLLNPNGGVLIIIEKGVPRGFELVAGAREILLRNHIAAPGAADVENEEQLQNLGRFYKKEPGMIIAPCTNHNTCPMYDVPGQMTGRKDHCHFSQRFVRPPFLQRILGAKFHNHEDIQFSYLAVRRGRDEREKTPTPQNEESTLAALKGFEADNAEPNMLTLPRLLAPAIKGHKHVTFDLCTPAGNLERWIVPKSFSKQAYRDARKARWGDLWALGAKTRALRKSRSGSAKPRPKTRRIEVDVGETEEQDIIRDVAEQYGRKDKRGKKRTKPPKRLRVGDLE